MAKKTEVVNNTKTKKKTATTGEKPVVKTAQTKSSVTRKPVVTAKSSATSKPRKAASTKPLQDVNHNYVVFGTVKYTDATPAAGLTVIAYDKDESGSDTLGKPVVTTATGSFSISYSAADFRKSKKEIGGADVIVCVYNAKQELLFTSKKKNSTPEKYELNITVSSEQLVVRGKVTDANQKPLANMSVQVFDQDLRHEEFVDKTATDAWGNFRFVIASDKFRRADSIKPLRPELIVRVFDDGKTKLAESPRVRPEDHEVVIDLIVPVLRLSEWEILAQEIIPLLVGQGKDGQLLPPWEINDDDVAFLVEEAGLEREQVRIWAAAAKMAHEVVLFGTAPNMAMELASVGHSATSVRQSDALEFIVFYGWLRDEQPQDFAALLNLGSSRLLASLDHAIAQHYIPDISKLKERMQAVIDARQVSEVLKPAPEGEPASFGDVLNIAVADDKTHRAKIEASAPDIYRVTQSADMFSADIVTELDGKFQDTALAARVANAFRINKIVLGHTPLLEALRDRVVATEPVARIALAPLATMDKSAWMESVYQHGTPRSGALAPEQYAEHLHSAVEEAAPVAVLMHVLQSHPLFAVRGAASHAGVAAGSHVSANVRPAAQEQLYKAFQKHPTIDIVGRDPADLASEMGLGADASGLLGRLTRLKRLDMRWDEAATLMNCGLNHVGMIIDQGYKGFAAMMDERIAPHRINGIWQRARKTQAMSIGLMGYLQPMLYGTGIAVKETQRNVPRAKKLISENPTLAKLFGSIDNCYCDPCRSVLSPAAYLADLLKFIDYSKDVVDDVDAGRALRTRRPDVFDLELSCDNSKVELSHIDLVNEILENAIALPFEVLLSPDMDPADELGKPFLDGEMLAALQSTSTDSLENLVGKLDPSDSETEFGVSHWVVSDRFRRWTLTAADEYLGLRPANRPGVNWMGVDKEGLFRTLEQNGILDLRDVQPLMPLLRQSFGMNELPLEVTGITSRQLDHGRRWNLAVIAEGRVQVVLGPPGVVRLTAPNGQPGSRIFQNLQHGTTGSIARSLDAGQFPRELRNLCGIVSRANITITKTGPLSWRYSITLDKIQLVYRLPSLRITGIAYQSSDAGKNLMLRPQNRNPLAYAELDSAAAVFPWTLPYDAALQETRALLDKAGSPRLGWLSVLTPGDRRADAPVIVQDLLGLSHRQYELIATAAAGNKSHWGFDAGGDLMQLRKVSEIMQRARLSFAELQELMGCAVVNPGNTFGIDLQDCCDPAKMLLTGSDAGFPGLLDRLHRFVRLWRALGWDAKTLDSALNPMRSAAPVLNGGSLITLAHILATSRLLSMEVARVCGWFSATTSGASATRPARELQLAQALGLSADEYATARQVLTWALAVQAADFPFDSPADLRRFVEEIQFVKASGQSWSVLGFTLLHLSPDFDTLNWPEARTRQWLTTLYSQSALPLPEAIAGNTTETPGEVERRWLSWGLVKLPSGQWSVADPASQAQQLMDADPLRLLSRIDVLSQQTDISVALLKVCLLSPAVNDSGQAALTMGTTGGIERVNGLLVKYLDRLRRVSSWMHATKPLAIIASCLAQESGAEPSVVEELLDQPLGSNTTGLASHELLKLLLENPLRSLAGAAALLPFQDILMRVHKLLLLNKAWQGKSEHLRWLKDGPAPRFAGLQPLSLPAATVTAGQVSAGLYRAWKQTTTLLSLARISPGITRVLQAYSQAGPDSPATFPRWAVLAEAFCLVDTSGMPRSNAVGLLAQQLGDTPAQRLDPLWLGDLCAALALMQRFGASLAAVENILDIGAARPGTATVNAARALLQRLGDEACQEALGSVENKLREERRDRLVDFLLWRERDRLLDVNALYEHYLIDPQMSSCMNTTRMLQATAAVQLFVQRCLMNLENQGLDPVSPSIIDANAWNWMRNYRVWEANRKVFLYPENWLFPEVRDDRTASFRAFEASIQVNPPGLDSAQSATERYLNEVALLSTIQVVGLWHENGPAAPKSNTFVVGRSNNSSPGFFWRTAKNFGQTDMCWDGWSKVDASISGDHILPIFFNGRLHIIWMEVDEPEANGSVTGGSKDFGVRMRCSYLSGSGWKTVNCVSSPVTFRALPGKSAINSFEFRVQRDASEVIISCYVAEEDPCRIVPQPRPGSISFSPDRSTPVSLMITGEVWVGQPATGWAGGLQPTEPRGGYKILLLPVSEGTSSSYVGHYINSPVEVTTDSRGFFSFSFQASEEIEYHFFKVSFRVFLRDDSGHDLAPFREVRMDPNYSCTTAHIVFVIPGDVTPAVVDAERRVLLRKKGMFRLTSDYESGYLSVSQGVPESVSSVNNVAAVDIYKNGAREKAGLSSDAFDITRARGMPVPVFGNTPGQFFVISSHRDRDEVGDVNKTPPPIWYYEDLLGKILFTISRNASNAASFLDFTAYPLAMPYFRELAVNSKSQIEDLFSVPVQQSGRHFASALSIRQINTRRLKVVDSSEIIDGPSFTPKHPSSVYNWEFFYHLPIYIATFLSRQHRYEDARKWFHVVFDPTTNDSGPGGERFWRFLPFRDAQLPDTITKLLEVLAKPLANQQKKREVQNQIAAWLEDPFNPFAVARLRPSAFEWYTVIAYIQNLIAWADQLFRRDTRESINEATLLYVMASQILGPRPENIRNRGERTEALSYRSLKALKGDLDGFSNVWLSLADTPYGQSILNDINVLDAQHDYDPALEQEYAQLSSIGSLYFCVPPNEKLPELWDLVDDRLFKIRHCQNIEGARRELALYEPPIDPELLIRAKAAGLDLADVLADRFAPLPHYRFQVLLQKANEFCSEVKGLGGAILSAIEKREGERLALLRSSQEIEMLKLIESIKQEQIREAQANIDSLEKTKRNAMDRFAFLQRQLGKTEIKLDATGSPIVEQSLMTAVQESGAPDGFSALSLIYSEIEQIRNMELSNTFSLIAGVTRFSASASHLAGSINLIAKNTAEAIGFSSSALGDAFGTVASQFSHQEHRYAQMAGWQRRRDDWVQQSRMTAEEIRQIDKQIVALEIRKSIADKELDNHRTQIEHARNIDDFMRHIKFTGESLYGWMEGQLAGLFFAAYQLAFELAKKAERAYQFELGEPASTFVEYGHWDGLRKGLLSGERLGQNLRRMEAAYLERNRRELEITKHVSLRQLDPEALLKLRRTDRCEFSIPEVLFDLDFPGHYFRRIKSASVSVPCVVGPYVGVTGTLRLMSSKLRDKAIVSATYQDEANHKTSYLPTQAIATSTGQNDSGLFELNFRDERYLPFEGAGAISSWEFELPSTIKAFDYDTISDLILHVRYTARDGGQTLETAARGNLVGELNRAEGKHLVQLISVRHDFPQQWAAYRAATSGSLTLTLSDEYFPYLFRTRVQIVASEIKWYSDSGLISGAATTQVSAAGLPLTIEVTGLARSLENVYALVIYTLTTNTVN